MKPTLLVLAAGIGSRFGGLKQISAVGPGNSTIIDYSVYDAWRAGFGKIVFVIRKAIEVEFKATVGRKFEQRLPVEYVYQELDRLPFGIELPVERTRPWGTAHALWVARAAVQEPFAAINADDFYGHSSFQMLAGFLKTVQDCGSNEYAMIGYILRNTLSEFGAVSRGVCQLDGDGYLQHVVELRNVTRNGNRARYVDESGTGHGLTGSETVSMNMWGFVPSIFDHVQDQLVEFLAQQGRASSAEVFIPTVIDRLISRGQVRVSVFPSNELWFGITYQQDLPYVVDRFQDLVKQGIYPEKLWD
jgi:NDP-sugar pyrophosphorylase family protein